MVRHSFIPAHEPVYRSISPEQDTCICHSKFGITGQKITVVIIDSKLEKGFDWFCTDPLQVNGFVQIIIDLANADPAKENEHDRQ